MKALKTLLVAAAAGAMMTMAAGAMAQAPGGGPGAGPPRGGPGGPGMGAPLDRAGAIQRFGLGDPALNLTAAQKAELDKAADVYVAEMAKLPPMQMGQGGPPSPEAMAPRNKVRDDFNAAIAKVLNADQKKTWDARPQRGAGGGMGGPGGAGGPPGGARPPGQ